MYLTNVNSRICSLPTCHKGSPQLTASFLSQRKIYPIPKIKVFGIKAQWRAPHWGQPAGLRSCARSSLAGRYEIRAESARLGLGSFVLQTTNTQGLDLHTDGKMCTDYLGNTKQTEWVCMKQEGSRVPRSSSTKPWLDWDMKLICPAQSEHIRATKSADQEECLAVDLVE